MYLNCTTQGTIVAWVLCRGGLFVGFHATFLQRHVLLWRLNSSDRVPQSLGFGHGFQRPCESFGVHSADLFGKMIRNDVPNYLAFFVGDAHAF